MKKLDHAPALVDATVARPVDAGAKFRLLRWAARDRERLNETDIRVLIVLIDLFNATKGYAWPSFDKLAEETGSGRRNVIRSVNKLVELGIILRKSGWAQRVVNNYIPNFGLADEAGGVTGASASTGTTLVPQLRHYTSASTAALYTSYPRSISVGGEEVSAAAAAAAPGGAAAAGADPSKSTLANMADGFERFWSAYPKKEGRKHAAAAYAHAVAMGVAPDLLRSKAVQYSLAVAAKDPRWVKMPVYWLRDEAWLDDPQPPGPKGTAKDKRTTENGARRGAKRRSGPRRGARRRSGQRLPSVRRAPASMQPRAAQRAPASMQPSAAQRQAKPMATAKPSEAQRQAVLNAAATGPKTIQGIHELCSRAGAMLGSAVIERIVKAYAPTISKIPRDRYSDIGKDIGAAIREKSAASVILD